MTLRLHGWPDAGSEDTQGHLACASYSIDPVETGSDSAGRVDVCRECARRRGRGRPASASREPSTLVGSPADGPSRCPCPRARRPETRPSLPLFFPYVSGVPAAPSPCIIPRMYQEGLSLAFPWVRATRSALTPVAPPSRPAERRRWARACTGPSGADVWVGRGLSTGHRYCPADTANGFLESMMTHMTLTGAIEVNHGPC